MRPVAARKRNPDGCQCACAAGAVVEAAATGVGWAGMIVPALAGSVPVDDSAGASVLVAGVGAEAAAGGVAVVVAGAGVEAAVAGAGAGAVAAGAGVDAATATDAGDAGGCVDSLPATTRAGGVDCAGSARGGWMVRTAGGGTSTRVSAIQ